jgi:hypothetical protein
MEMPTRESLGFAEAADSAAAPREPQPVAPTVTARATATAPRSFLILKTFSFRGNDVREVVLGRQASAHAGW